MERNFVLAVNHFDPDYLYVISYENESEHKKLLCSLNNSDSFCYSDVENESKLVRASWNDESITWDELGNDINEVYNETEEMYAQALKNTRYGYYWDAYSKLSGLTWCADDFEGSRLENQLTPKKLLENDINYIKNSYVDGDSNEAVVILDLDEQVNLFESTCGEDIVFISAENFLEGFNEDGEFFLYIVEEEEEECEHPKKLTRKYIYIDVDFEDAEVVAKQLNDAIQQIQTIHHTMGISDKTIKVGVDPNKKQLNIMYYGFQD